MLSPATIRNMTLEELTQHVEQYDDVPRDVVQALISAFEVKTTAAIVARDVANDCLNDAVADIEQLVAEPLDSKDQYHKALQDWVEDWKE